MATAINPDPHAKGYRFSPKYRVTAVLNARDHISFILRSLHAAGFTDNDIEIFVGEEGAEKLDLSGARHGVIVKVLRRLQLATADEENLYKEFDQAVRDGGLGIDVKVEEDQQRKSKAAEILRNYGAHDICYWGRWIIEQLG